MCINSISYITLKQFNIIIKMNTKITKIEEKGIRQKI